ncbi:hypothetical protein POM88_027117 [Heracleum sosnowskyi]|uniref:Uncharacterized protein n=1 Tax=Heracleum sosnowskyi TaxID=360622 RepID=A0AAD8MQP7_9APIA|nr:hypothetical protein POM88_027117 [Heracleum sosnowskyi]
MKFYGVRIFGIIQFDYYDNGLFNVNIFKKIAIECYYPLSDPRAYKKSEAAKEYNVDEFLINFDSLEYFKRIEQLSFNGFFLEPHYAEIEIMTKDIDPISPVLVLNQRLKSFYRNWENGSKVIFKIMKRTWEIDIQWEAVKCMFQKG